MNLRTASPGDHEAIASFTRDTFDWGDYVGDEFPRWLDDPDTQVFVAEDHGRAVALVRVVMMSSNEAWLASARVAPSHRGRGLASELNDLCMAWARGRGAVVGRLAVEDWNEPAWRQVRKLGFRSVSGWNYTRWIEDRTVPAASVRLEPADVADVEAAFGAWSAGELARSAHGLFPVGWTWRRMFIEDLTASAGSGTLLMSQDGWVMAESSDEGAWVPWLQTDHRQAPGLITSLLGLFGQTVRLMLPSVAWLDETLARLGFSLDPMQIYEKEIRSEGEDEGGAEGPDHVQDR